MKNETYKMKIATGIFCLLVGAGLLLGAIDTFRADDLNAYSDSRIILSENLSDERLNTYANELTVLREMYGQNNVITVYVSEDAMTVEGNPLYPYGPHCIFQIRAKASTGNYDQDCFLKFDLTDIIDPVKSATLKIKYINTWDSSPAGRKLNIYTVTESWDESTITWENQPACSSQPFGFSIVPDSTGVWMSWDVTEDVKSFVAGTKENYGWKISDDNLWVGASIPMIVFSSKDCGDAIPYLEIEFGGIDELTADAGGPYLGDVGEDIQFHGNAYGGSSPYTYLWDFGDGKTGTGQDPTHSYDRADEYSITLTVTDSVGNTAKDVTSASIGSTQCDIVISYPKLHHINVGGTSIPVPEEIRDILESFSLGIILDKNINIRVDVISGNPDEVDFRITSMMGDIDRSIIDTEPPFSASSSVDPFKLYKISATAYTNGVECDHEELQWFIFVPL